MRRVDLKAIIDNVVVVAKVGNEEVETHAPVIGRRDRRGVREATREALVLMRFVARSLAEDGSVVYDVRVLVPQILEADDGQ